MDYSSVQFCLHRAAGVWGRLPAPLQHLRDGGGLLPGNLPRLHHHLRHQPRVHPHRPHRGPPKQPHHRHLQVELQTNVHTEVHQGPSPG